MTEVARRTKRRFAHELYPHAQEGEVRPLSVEVPYLYARAVGLEVFDTEWSKAEPIERFGRVEDAVQAALLAFLADALSQGMTGDEAWAWAYQLASTDVCADWVCERATHYGVDVDAIKPYPCGPEPTHHDHVDEQRFVTRVEGREDDCPDCTEPEPPADQILADAEVTR